MAQITSISNGEAMSSVRTKLNDVITNVNLLDPTDWVDYSATSTVVGWSSFTTKWIFYRVIGKQIFVSFRLTGTSNSTSATFTLPFNAGANFIAYSLNVGITDNGATSNTPGRVNSNTSSNLITITKDNSGNAFTATGTKTLLGQIFLQIA